MASVKIGILAFQGAFEEHKRCLENAWDKLGSNATLDIVIVKRPNDLTDLDGLILPGGESTTMSKFLERNNFQRLISDLVKGHNGKLPVTWGTCAGLILLANTVNGTKSNGQNTIGGIDVTVNRNTYGRQNESFEASLMLTNDELKGNNGINGNIYHGVFIRAPGIVSVDSNRVEVLAELTNIDHQVRPVAVRQGNLLATTFHPELTDDDRWHKYFLQMVLERGIPH